MIVDILGCIIYACVTAVAVMCTVVLGIEFWGLIQ